MAIDVHAGVHTGFDDDARSWWAAKRRVWSVALVLAGVAAFACYAAALELGLRRGRLSDDMELMLLTTFVQSAGYLMAIAVSNGIYRLAASVERAISPHDVARYRRWAFAAGLSVSVALPFVPAAVLTIAALR